MPSTPRASNSCYPAGLNVAQVKPGLLNRVVELWLPLSQRKVVGGKHTKHRGRYNQAKWLGGRVLLSRSRCRTGMVTTSLRLDDYRHARQLGENATAAADRYPIVEEDFQWAPHCNPSDDQ
jgi:hypothetical protein